MKIFIFLFASFIALSCSSNKKQAISNTNDFNTKTTVDSFKYEELTVQFLNNWKLVENSNQDSNSKMLIWEREGIESSGQFIVTITNIRFDLDFVLNLMKSNLFSSIPINKSLIKENDIRKIKYLGVDALDQKYRYEYKGSYVSGRFLVFRKNNKTFTLLFQTDESDKEKNIEGFEYFEKNLKINSR